MELTVPSVNRNSVQHTIGKERAALFRHYRVVAHKRKPDIFLGKVKRDIRSVHVFHPDNGR